MVDNGRTADSRIPDNGDIIEAALVQLVQWRRLGGGGVEIKISEIIRHHGIVARINGWRLHAHPLQVSGIQLQVAVIVVLGRPCGVVTGIGTFYIFWISGNDCSSRSISIFHIGIGEGNGERIVENLLPGSGDILPKDKIVKLAVACG